MTTSKFTLTQLVDEDEAQSIRKQYLAAITDQGLKDQMARQLQSAQRGIKTAEKNIANILQDMEKLNSKWPTIMDGDGKQLAFMDFTVRQLETASSNKTTVRQFEQVSKTRISILHEICEF